MIYFNYTLTGAVDQVLADGIFIIRAGKGPLLCAPNGRSE